MKRLIIALILLLGLVTVLWPAAAAAKTTDDKLFAACAQAPDSPICKDKNTSGNPITKTINTAANIIALITGVAAVIIIIVSGLMFTTAGGATPGQRAGDPNAIKKARLMLTGAIAGLVIVALAWTITRFVTDKFIQ